jgi:hypothetical protein
MTNQTIDNALGGYEEVVEAVKEAVVSPEERKLLLDRRFAFCGDAQRIVWTEMERITRLQMVENYWTTGSDLA